VKFEVDAYVDSCRQCVTAGYGYSGGWVGVCEEGAVDLVLC